MLFCSSSSLTDLPFLLSFPSISTMPSGTLYNANNPDVLSFDRKSSFPFALTQIRLPLCKSCSSLHPFHEKLSILPQSTHPLLSVWLPEQHASSFVKFPLPLSCRLPCPSTLYLFLLLSTVDIVRCLTYFFSIFSRAFKTLWIACLTPQLTVSCLTHYTDH